ncbi:uncharacterized protein LOC115644036 [Gopherus evgoodei]|uniref:uncharacterized protein LOC115644036 n=1 Tax=Gopherus evgoodei TaxID=1825980 RepID=UPI0011CFB4C0|nr:uncharacterized protein LOC115644036 [Gopherus evgoodei]
MGAATVVPAGSGARRPTSPRPPPSTLRFGNRSSFCPVTPAAGPWRGRESSSGAAAACGAARCVTEIRALIVQSVALFRQVLQRPQQRSDPTVVTGAVETPSEICASVVLGTAETSTEICVPIGPGTALILTQITPHPCTGHCTDPDRSCLHILPDAAGTLNKIRDPVMLGVAESPTEVRPAVVQGSCTDTKIRVLIVTGAEKTARVSLPCC